MIYHRLILTRERTFIACGEDMVAVSENWRTVNCPKCKAYRYQKKPPKVHEKRKPFQTRKYLSGRSRKVKDSMDKRFGKTPPDPKMTSNWDFL